MLEFPIHSVITSEEGNRTPYTLNRSHKGRVVNPDVSRFSTRLLFIVRTRDLSIIVSIGYTAGMIACLSEAVALIVIV